MDVRGRSSEKIRSVVEKSNRRIRNEEKGIQYQANKERADGAGEGTDQRARRYIRPYHSLIGIMIRQGFVFLAGVLQPRLLLRGAQTAAGDGVTEQ